MQIKDLIKEYEALLRKKDMLAAETKMNNALIEQAEAEIIAGMIDDDISGVEIGGYNYSLATKTMWNKKPEAELYAEGLDFIETLKEQGLGDIVVQKVDPRTLNSTINALIEESGSLPEELEAVLKPYEQSKISRRKTRR